MKAVPEMPEDMLKHVFKYNITDNSITSTPLAKQLRKLFEITDDNFSLFTSEEELKGYKIIVLSKEVIEIQENGSQEEIIEEKKEEETVNFE